LSSDYIFVKSDYDSYHYHNAGSSRSHGITTFELKVIKNNTMNLNIDRSIDIDQNDDNRSGCSSSNMITNVDNNDNFRGGSGGISTISAKLHLGTYMYTHIYVYIYIFMYI
jgi:hypothetical protein